MRNTTTSRRMPRRSLGGAGQRGVAAIFFAISMVALLVSLLLAVNIGMLYYAQRDLQKQASLAAVSAARIASGCGGTNGAPGTLAAVTQAALATFSNNATSYGTATLATIGGQPGVQLGQTFASNNGLNSFKPLAEGDPNIDSVRVTVTMASPAILGSGLLPGVTPQALYASATARQKAFGDFNLSSTVATVNTGNSALLNGLLSGLLGTSVNLSVSNLNNLLNSKISLGQLEAAVGVNNLNDLLSTSLTLKQAETALGTALTNSTDGVSQAAGGLVSGLAGQAYTTPPGSNVNFGDIFNNLGGTLNPAASDVLSSVPFVSGMQLLQALGEDASKGKSIALPVGVTVPGLAAIGVFLNVGSPAVIPVPGPVGTSGSTAQVTVQARISVDPTLVAGLLNFLKGLVSVGTPINLGIDATVAAAQGTLSSLSCPSAANPTPTAGVTVATQLATLQIGTFSGSAPYASAPPLAKTSSPLLSVSLIGIPILNVTLAGPAPSTPAAVGSAQNASVGPFTQYLAPVQAGTGDNHTYQYTAIGSLTLDPPAVASNPVTVGTGDLLSSLPAAAAALTAYPGNMTITALGLFNLSAVLGPLVSALSSAVLTPLTSLLDSVVDPLLQLLGIQVASATVNMNAVFTGQAVLVSTCLPGSTGAGCGTSTPQ